MKSILISFQGFSAAGHYISTWQNDKARPPVILFCYNKHFRHLADYSALYGGILHIET